MSGAPTVKYERELRLAVVMYGGVSLAVYMNGATQELLNLVRATAPDPKKKGYALYTDDELKGTSAFVYRKLARLDDAGAAGAELSDPLQPIRRRFVVDILSGTSAGGINAVYLAKALANGQSVEGLAGLWESEGDLGKLINDDESRTDCPDLPSTNRPKSLLNSQRMYVKLLEAFESMDRGPAQGRLVDGLDLYVTATDLEGLPIRLQLAGGEVAEEKKYRKSFHLCFQKGGTNSFERQDNPFLAFISRCTSSFPVAFEPTQFRATVQLGGTGGTTPADVSIGTSAAIPARWSEHFDEYDAASDGLQNPQQRPFADGGYLDNKPFSYAIDAISSRHVGDSGLVERKLIYIEPDPERLSTRGAQKPSEPPNALDNSLAVVQLRGYETIREELLRLRDRNRLVDKTRAVVAGVDADFESLDPTSRKDLAEVISRREEFGERALDHVVAVFGAAYGGYHRLKAAQLTDELAEIIAQNAGIALASDEFLAIRLLVRAWRDAKYAPNPKPKPSGPALPSGPTTATGAAVATVAATPVVEKESEFKFLSTFGLSYRIRRVSFVLERIAHYRTLSPHDLAKELGQYRSICDGETAEAIAEDQSDPLADAFDELRRELATVAQELRAVRKRLLAPEPGNRIAEISRRAKLIREAAEKIMAQPTEDKRNAVVEEVIRGAPGQAESTMDALEDMQRAIQKEVAKAAKAGRERCEKALQTDSRPQLQTRKLTSAADVAQFVGRHYYTWYELYDSMVFPIVYGSEVGEEIAPVEAIRISPLSRLDPKGRGLADPKLMPSGVAVAHFGAFLDAQWRARDILIGRMNAAEKLIRTVMAGRHHEDPAFVETLVQEVHETIVEEQYRKPGSIVGKQLDALKGLDTAQARVSYVKQKGLPADELKSASVFDWIARSARVMGRVLREATQRVFVKRMSAGLLYSGYILAGMVEVVFPPRHWWGNLVRLWVPRMFLFAGSLILLGVLLAKEQVAALGWTTLFIVVAFMGLTLVLRLVAHREWSLLLRVATAACALVIVALLTVGFIYMPDAIATLWHRLRAVF